MPVCKRKYQPYRRRRTTPPPCKGESEQGAPRAIQGEEEEEEEDLEEMYACHLHHAKRKALIERHGQRDGWENFDQWHRRHGPTITCTAAESFSSGGGNDDRRIMRASDEEIDNSSVDRTSSTSIVADGADVGIRLATTGGTAGEDIDGGNSGRERKRPRAER